MPAARPAGPTRLSWRTRPGWSRPRSAISGRGTWRTQAAAGRPLSHGWSRTSTTCWRNSQLRGRARCCRGADRLRQRSHGGQVRPGRGGGADRPPTWPELRQGSDARHRPRFVSMITDLVCERLDGTAPLAAGRARGRPGRMPGRLLRRRPGPASGRPVSFQPVPSRRCWPRLLAKWRRRPASC